MSAINDLSTKISNSVDAETVGLPYLEIFALVTQFITALMNCGKEQNITPEESKEKFQEKYEANPRQVENRVKHQIRVSNRKDGKPKLSGAALDEVASKAIAELLAADQQTLVDCRTEME
jgi:hypothetical protein